MVALSTHLARLPRCSTIFGECYTAGRGPRQLRTGIGSSLRQCLTSCPLEGEYPPCHPCQASLGQTAVEWHPRCQGSAGGRRSSCCLPGKALCSWCRSPRSHRRGLPQPSFCGKWCRWQWRGRHTWSTLCCQWWKPYRHSCPPHTHHSSPSWNPSHTRSNCPARLIRSHCKPALINIKNIQDLFKLWNDLITFHALEGALGVDAELILTLALLPNLALVNVLKSMIIIVWDKCWLIKRNWKTFPGAPNKLIALMVHLTIIRRRPTLIIVIPKNYINQTQPTQNSMLDFAIRYQERLYVRFSDILGMSSLCASAR